jgi:ribose transport system ATP-binding protein
MDGSQVRLGHGGMQDMEASLEPTVPLLELQGINKKFGATQALQDVHLSIEPGSIIGIAGLNGSGKSTLLRVIGGIVKPDSGTIQINGKERRLDSPRDSIDSGIALVHQELSLAPSLTPLQNIFLGHEYTRHYLLDWNRMRKEAEGILSRLGVKIDLDLQTKELGIADQQLVEIAKALSLESKLICLDEPTSALNEAEVERLFACVRSLQAEGKSVLFVSHNVNEFVALCHEVIVLVGGHIGSRFSGESMTPELIAEALFAGTQHVASSRRRDVESKEPVLRLMNLRGRLLQDFSLNLWRGEVLGLYGLLGSGIEELPLLLFGLRKHSGKVELQGRELTVKRPAQATRSGIAYIPPDRRIQGLFTEKSIAYNTSILTLDELSKRGILQVWKERGRVKVALRDMQVVYRDTEQRVKELSGGNQQKVLVGKWLTIEPKMIMAHEPFRGIDIVTKDYLKGYFRKLAESGIGIMIISSELEEIIDACDRILVVKNGRVASEFAARSFEASEILLAAS